MTIKKIGHCCLVIKEKELTILTDSGSWTSEQDKERGIDLVLITHEHPDHLHIDSLVAVFKNNPNAEVVTNSTVGKILENQKIRFTLLEEGQKIERNGVLIEGFGSEHAYIYQTVPNVQNTGYFIGDKLFYPGDAFHNPGKEVELLALPVAGPWMKIADAIDYAKEIKPKKCFPVHDGMIKDFATVPIRRIPKNALLREGIEFVALEEGETIEL